MRTGRIVVPAALLLALSVAPAAQAQPGPERLEVAVNVSMLRAGDFGLTNAGVGGRVTFSLTKHVALEGDADYVPNHRITSSENRIGGGMPYWIAYDHNRTTGLFGVKIGTYTARFGAFAKARPGVTHSKQTGPGCLGAGCAALQMPPAETAYRTEFAFDVGGGFEVYPTGRTVARVELGDTIIRHDSPSLTCSVVGNCTSHNVASRIGFGWRF